VRGSALAWARLILVEASTSPRPLAVIITAAGIGALAREQPILGIYDLAFGIHAHALG
jgi:hypothetical protein